jgi:murein DD-endopeptidase MepM/ murein hydrolase activator NlpD
MTAFPYRATMIALAAASLGACTTDRPQFSTRDTSAPGSPPQSIDQAAAQAQPQQQPPRALDDDRYSPAPAPSQPVTGEALPPVNHRPGGGVDDTIAEDLPPPPPPPPPTVVHTRTRAPVAAPPVQHYTVSGPVQNAADPLHTVIIEKGDTVNVISDRLLTPKKLIIETNKLKKPYELEVGQSLQIPAKKVYVVQSGDSLFSVARRFTVPAQILADLNGFEVHDHIRAGQRIALPAGSKDIGPIPRAATPAELAAANEPRPEPAPRPVPVRRRPPVVVASSEPPENTAESTGRELPPPPPTTPSTPRPYTSLGDRPTRPSRPYVAPPTRAYPPPTTSLGVDAAPPPSDSQVSAAGRGRFIWPVHGDVLSNFGAKPGGQRNDGVDIGAPDRSAVVASASGDVVYAGDQIPGFGNLVLIKHEGGWVTAYAHLAVSEVKIREHVSQGAEIGQVGETGGVSQPELHFEIRYAPTARDKARPIDPKLVLSGDQ